MLKHMVRSEKELAADDPQQVPTYSVTYPNASSKYVVIACLLNIGLLAIMNATNVESIRIAASIAFVLVQVFLFIRMYIEIRQKHTLLLREKELFIGKQLLTPEQLTEVTFTTNYIDLHTNRRNWSERVVRFRFAGSSEKDRAAERLRAWLTRHEVKTRKD
ncbi:hypothetical protein [Paenibacillus spongiae]|uniref:DUF2244 domain-containing protein n=1 Tax=Paenibacillus spongiae TaxID=2909671 RepID=A0ABY5S3D5_9BACL|nr:hypothetical protein [Paenibacillus spongiae]UVI27983.1 hypothetical protein L1F29_21315 [Paenibacillus spongiae]